MIRGRKVAQGLVGALLAAGAVGLAVACSTSDTATASADDGAVGSDALGGDGGSGDAGVNSDAAGDARTIADASMRDANGPGEAGADCSFNADCQAALRCECDTTNGCACKPGVRGSGRNGIDPCSSGNACASAVCVEGPADAGFFCSDECVTSADCGGKLPLCSTIAFVGRICIRTP